MANRKSRKQNKTKQNKTKQNKTKQNKTKQNRKKYLNYKKGGDNKLSPKLQETLKKVYTSIVMLIENIKSMREKYPEFYMLISFYPPDDEYNPTFMKGGFYLIQSDNDDPNKFYMISNDSISRASILETIYIDKPARDDINFDRLLIHNIIHEFNDEGKFLISRTSFEVQFFKGHFFNKEYFPDYFSGHYISKLSYNINDYNIDDDLLIPLKKCEDNTSEVTSTNSPPPKKSWFSFSNQK